MLACGILVGISEAGRYGTFGHFGLENDVTGNAFPMLAFLAAAMGMINAVEVNRGLAHAYRAFAREHEEAPLDGHPESESENIPVWDMRWAAATPRLNDRF